MNTQEVAPARPYINRLRAVIHAAQKLDTFICLMNMPVLMMLNNQNPPEETAVECPGEQNIIDPQNVYVQLCGIDDPAKMALMCDDSIYGFIDGQWKKIVDIPCKQEHYLYPPNFSEHLADMFVLLAQEFIKAKAALTADGK